MGNDCNIVINGKEVLVVYQHFYNKTGHRELTRKPQFTVCGILINETDFRPKTASTSDNWTLHIGIAVCNAKDQFCKARGRQIANERATYKPIKTVTITAPRDEAVAQSLCIMDDYEITAKEKPNAFLESVGRFYHASKNCQSSAQRYADAIAGLQLPAKE